jgi:hypothetical protein
VVPHRLRGARVPVDRLLRGRDAREGRPHRFRRKVGGADRPQHPLRRGVRLGGRRVVVAHDIDEPLRKVELQGGVGPGRAVVAPKDEPLQGPVVGLLQVRPEPFLLVEGGGLFGVVVKQDQLAEVVEQPLREAGAAEAVRRVRGRPVGGRPGRKAVEQSAGEEARRLAVADEPLEAGVHGPAGQLVHAEHAEADDRPGRGGAPIIRMARPTSVMERRRP